MWDVQTPGFQELDTLYRMFPKPSTNPGDYWQPQSLTGFESYGYDFWSGILDMSTPAVPDGMLEVNESVT
jgi:hypothetical protein